MQPIVKNKIECRSIEDIIDRITYWKGREDDWEKLVRQFPNDFDYQRQLYGAASIVNALEWVLFYRYE